MTCMSALQMNKRPTSTLIEKQQVTQGFNIIRRKLFSQLVIDQTQEELEEQLEVQPIPEAGTVLLPFHYRAQQLLLRIKLWISQLQLTVKIAKQGCGAVSSDTTLEDAKRFLTTIPTTIIPFKPMNWHITVIMEILGNTIKKPHPLGK